MVADFTKPIHRAKVVCEAQEGTIEGEIFSIGIDIFWLLDFFSIFTCQ